MVRIRPRNRITPCLWFDGQAEEAARLYTSIFANSRIGHVTRYDGPTAAESGLPEGTVMTVEMELDGHPFLALNGGPLFSFSQAVSFIVDCEDQEEVDHFWNALSAGGEEQQCGWLKDRFGVSWQIVPTLVQEIVRGPDPAATARAMTALMQMKKLDVAALRRAWEGGEGTEEER